MAQDYVEIVSQAFAVARGGQQKPIFNVWHFRRSLAVTTPSKSLIEISFQSVIMTPLLATVHVDYTQIANTVRFFDDALDAPISFPETGVGGVTVGDRMETFVAAVFNYKSNTRGKFARGSKHIAPLAESQSVGDVLTSGAITTLQALADAFKAGFVETGGNVWVPIVKSSKPPAQYALNPVTLRVYDVVGVTVNHTTGTMRRRKVKTVL